MTTTKPSASTTSLTTPTLNTKGLSAQEIKDRQAIQNAWVKYWIVLMPLTRTPPSGWRKVASTVIADPLLTDVLRRTAEFKTKGVENYGYVDHHFYWGPPVDGKNYAIVGDCMDTSKLGTLNIKTGEKLTVGLAKDSARISFQRGPDMVWRATNIQYLDSSC